MDVDVAGDGNTFDDIAADSDAPLALGSGMGLRYVLPIGHTSTSRVGSLGVANPYLHKLERQTICWRFSIFSRQACGMASTPR